MLKSPRDGFGAALLDSGASSDFLVLGADLAGATRTSKFAAAYPDRFIDIGIAESNMIGVASGLAFHGNRVVLSSFGSFLTGRYDQIRCSLAQQGMGVILVGTHSGMAIGKDGSTQMGLEDINLMRGLPSMHILQPSTYTEAYEITNHLLRTYDLVYLRLARQSVNDYPEETVMIDKKIKKIVEVQPGRGLTIAYSGCMRELAFAVGNTNKVTYQYQPRILNVLSIKPLDYKTLLSCDGPIITIEDHSIIGGLGSAVAEAAATYSPRRVVRIGLDETFASSGSPDDLYIKYGFTVDSILRKYVQVS